MRFIILVFSLCLCSLLSAHPTHISITNIDITDSVISILIKVDENDFIHYLNELNTVSHNKEYYFTEGKGLYKTNDYLDENFQILVNKTPIELNNIKINSLESFVMIAYSLKLSKKCRTVQIINKILIDFLPDQTNLVIISRNNTEKGFEFTKNKWSESMEF